MNQLTVKQWRATQLDDLGAEDEETADGTAIYTESVVLAKDAKIMH